MIDAELKSIGELELVNAFYREYSQLVLKYQAAAAGLDFDRVTERISNASNPYSINNDTSLMHGLEINVVGKDGAIKTCDSMHEALEMIGDNLVIAGNCAFKWDDAIGWKYPDKEEIKSFSLAP